MASANQNMIEVIHQSGKRTAHYHKAQWARIKEKVKPVNGYYNGWKEIGGESGSNFAVGGNVNIPEKLKVHQAGKKSADPVAEPVASLEINVEKMVAQKAGEFHKELRDKVNELELEKEIMKEEMEKLHKTNAELNEHLDKRLKDVETLELENKKLMKENEILISQNANLKTNSSAGTKSAKKKDGQH